MIWNCPGPGRCDQWARGACADSAVSVLIPFTLLLGVSRMVRALHFPSDLAAAVGMGVAIGLTAGWLG